MIKKELIPQERLAIIVDLVRKKHVMTIGDLAQKLQVSQITIRRDLRVLENKKLIERTRGGALHTQPTLGERFYHEKWQLYTEFKKAAALRVGELIEDHETVFINSGSSTGYALRELRHRAVQIVTNNVTVMEDDNGLALAEIFFTGGQYRGASQCLTGEMALAVIDKVFANSSIIGADGLCLRAGLTSPIYQEARLTARMIERTQGRVIVISDSSKMGKLSSHQVAPLEKLDILITDNNIDHEIENSLSGAGVEVIKIKNQNREVNDYGL